MIRIQDINYSDFVKTEVICKKTAKKDTFKPLFCDPKFFIDQQTNFRTINQLISEQNLDKIDAVILWIALCTLLRRPKSWFGGYRQKKFKPLYTTKSFSLKFYTDNLGIAWPAKISASISLLELLNTVKIIPLPEVAHKSLLFILDKDYPVKIFDYEPTPLELLDTQCDGYRVITFKNDFENWPEQKFGQRDPLSFWLHDCIHAEHFFSKPDDFVSQLGFYKLMQKCLKLKILNLNRVNSEFLQAFSYLISDMNSHPLHLLKTFKAILEIHLKQESVHIWMQFIQASTASNRQCAALQNINTAFFSSEDCDQVLHLVKSLGAQS